MLLVKLLLFNAALVLEEPLGKGMILSLNPIIFSFSDGNV